MRAPWHLWVVGLVALVWNAGGGYDYLMTRTGDPAYLQGMPEEARAMIEGAPLWFDIGWGLGVWAAILGSLLLLLRSRWAVPAFALSILGVLLSGLWSFVLAEPRSTEVLGTFALVFSAAIVVVLVLLWLYARAMAERGVLR